MRIDLDSAQQFMYYGTRVQAIDAMPSQRGDAPVHFSGVRNANTRTASPHEFELPRTNAIAALQGSNRPELAAQVHAITAPPALTPATTPALSAAPSVLRPGVHK
jgi:hypothetical protein